ncbi:type II toxin-antitoxin system VapC family toxin [uncultured Desulfovibrio sp.]|mgnify:FL=1|uniref:type II toxin-antitoxin system tRNA(fMet)-specific endonuclease VapC n=1 Tax=uncultured Desulfovibrio sp. TaxID=167968 RepID=UPI002586FB32|nr:type II toxin-antitoxin system VapC family toxin [uncultured Desulfovibrio sp.]
MITALLDTNICIYLIKNNPPEVRERFAAYAPGEIGIASISVAELHYGVEKSASRERNARALEVLLLPLEIVPFDMAAAQIYGSIRAMLERRGTPIGGMDMLIAAVALARNCTLITHNLREFERIDGLRCESWAQR